MGEANRDVMDEIYSHRKKGNVNLILCTDKELASIMKGLVKLHEDKKLILNMQELDDQEPEED